MNYRHSFHAGNFADAFKHLVLIHLIQSLLKKETPFCYLETHAGAGCYDLQSAISQKNPEFKDGIAKMFAMTPSSLLIKTYLDCIKKFNPTEKLSQYPGSPLLAKQFLRPQDKMILSELHIDEYKSLKQLFRQDKQVAVHHQDGYKSLKALLPPAERRGLILIDPPYEKPDEMSLLPTTLKQCLKQWDQGIFALWYPIKHRTAIDRFHQALKHAIKRPYLVTELCIYPDDVPARLNGSGVAIINPPWQIEQSLEPALHETWQQLAQGQGCYTLREIA